MFDFSWSEIAIIVVVALIFIGPRDMPVAIRTVSRGIKSLRRMAAEFQTHVDDMVREADLGEARDHLRDLRRFDVRGQFMRAVDGDGAMRQGMGDLQARSRDPVPGVGFTPQYGGEATTAEPGEAAVSAQPDLMPEPASVPEAYGPSILPPAIARRLRDDRIHHAAPRIVPPPRAIHAGKRVSLESSDV